MSTKRVLLVILVASTVLLGVGVGPRVAGTARAQPPAQEAAPPGAVIPYTGLLSDDSEQPVVDGAYGFAFTLYDAESGGQPLWSEVQEEVLVRDGAFTTALGSATPIPAGVLDGEGATASDDRTLWLAVAVRGPGETEFTALTPRQKLSAASPTMPSSPTAAQACPHDHFGEYWSGTASGLGGLAVTNYDSFAFRGRSYYHDGVVGISAASGYMHSTLGNGVFGYSANDHGVYGYTDGDWGWRSGVYGETPNDHANGVTGWNTGSGVGVYGHSAAGWAGYYDGPVQIKGRGNTVGSSGLVVYNSDDEVGLWVRDDGTVSVGALSGSAGVHICSRIESADARNVFALCSSASEYAPTADLGLGFPETGDLVSLVPATGNQHGDGHAPFVVVKASSPYDPNLIGFITDPSMGADGLKLNDDYLPLAIYGYFAVKVTMRNGPIRRGDAITSSPEPGYGMKATRPGRIIGYALEDAEQDGVIQVFAQAGDFLGDAPERIDRLEAELLSLNRAYDALLAQNSRLEARIAALEALVVNDSGSEAGP